MRDNAEMMSSTTPSAKYSCSGSPLKFMNGKTAMEGLSGRASASAGVSFDLTGSIFEEPNSSDACASVTLPTNRNPLRAIVRIRRCSWPLSPTALRAALI
jgi:hypothetical protein